MAESAVVGQCQLMCPVEERLRREAQGRLDRLEMAPNTKTADPARTIKEYARPAAGSSPRCVHAKSHGPPLH